MAKYRKLKSYVSRNCEKCLQRSWVGNQRDPKGKHTVPDQNCVRLKRSGYSNMYDENSLFNLIAYGVMSP